MRREELEVDGDLVRRIPAEVAWKHEIVPLFQVKGRLYVAIAHGLGRREWLFARDDVQFTTGYDSWPVEVPRDELLGMLEKHYGPRPVT